MEVETLIVRVCSLNFNSHLTYKLELQLIYKCNLLYLFRSSIMLIIVHLLGFELYFCLYL